MDVMTALHLCYRTNGIDIVSNVSLKLKKREFTVIVGPNGAGKSTLLKLLAGSLKPSAGEVRLHGCSLTGMRPERLAKHRAVLSQHHQLSMDITARQLVELGRYAYENGGHTAESKAIIENAMKQTTTLHLSQRMVNSLSGGERQRLHLARVLAQVWKAEKENDTKLILLDEPITALDLKHQFEILRIVRERCSSGDTVIAVLHDLNLALHVADKVIVMKNGKIIAQGHPDIIMDEELLENIYEMPMSLHRLGHRVVIFPKTSVHPAHLGDSSWQVKDGVLPDLSN